MEEWRKNQKIGRMLRKERPWINWKIQFSGFKDLFARFLQVKPTVNWNQIKPLPEETIKPYNDLTEPSTDKVRSLLSKMVIVKLNGGLGTSMGCKGPKSLIPVRHDLTFLDLTMQQIEHLNLTHDVDIPLVLMNSFNTDQDTKRALRKYRNVKLSTH
ncbi:UTP--glucose-1-phosphate uridylyltransferase [Trichinella pseudospiralis]|uniref:UTP--glucose-1-phosphate uridylyltransferase n=1 Tax=Trichinella pseudospiralis TaxID=6337 RepID=A0A0V0YFS4_TRIPS|nr:UTP--glucose-1-phosphate uridylyltransferase [Trichinella pseudospiralis]